MIDWNKGKKLTLEHKEKIIKNLIHKSGKESARWKERVKRKCVNCNYLWKGDKVGYVGLHTRIYKMLGRPDVCEFCKRKITNANKIHWANKNHKYKDTSGDWIRLCAKCHKKYDTLFSKTIFMGGGKINGNKEVSN